MGLKQSPHGRWPPLHVPLLAAWCGLSLSCAGRYEPLPETGATLEGTVTYGRDALPMALIIVAGDQGSATGWIGDDGRYRVENAPLGDVAIGVNTDAAKGEAIGKAMARSQAKGPPPKLVGIPSKYFEPATSGIKTAIHKGENTFNLVIPR